MCSVLMGCTTCIVQCGLLAGIKRTPIAFGWVFAGLNLQLAVSRSLFHCAFQLLIDRSSRNGVCHCFLSLVCANGLTSKPFAVPWCGRVPCPRSVQFSPDA